MLKRQQKVDIKLSKICQSHQKLSEWQKVASHFTETAEQFFLLHTRYLCDFSGLTNFSQKLRSSKKTFISHFVYFFSFLAFDPQWILWCLPRKKVSPQECLLIPKANYRTVYPEKLFPWPPVCLLASEKVASFFICDWGRSVKFLSSLSEWVGDWWSSSAWDNSPG